MARQSYVGYFPVVRVGELIAMAHMAYKYDAKNNDLVLIHDAVH